MSIKGPAALAALDEALRDIRREEDEILRKLARGLERAAKFRESAGELLRQIASARLKEETGAALSAAIMRATAESRGTLAERSAELTRNAERLRATERKFGEFTAARAAALDEVDRQLAALRSLAPRIGAAVGRTPDYEQARREAAALKAMAAAARLKVRQADLDREQKGRAFRADPLFSYLEARGYDTPAYHAGALTAALDAWVAKLSGYAAAKANYDLLNALPGRLRAHTDALAAETARAEDGLDMLERQAIDAAGGSAQRVAMDAAQAQIATMDDALGALQDERDDVVAAQTRLADDRDPAFDRAVAGLVTALGSPDLASLTGGLKLRGGAELAALAGQLDELRLRLIEEQADSRELHDRLVVLADRRRGLESLESTFKARRFDDPRSLFRDDELIATKLDAYLTGALSAVAYLAAWQEAQGWAAGTSDWGGGIGLPRQGREPAETADEPGDPAIGSGRRAEAKAGA